MVAFWSPGWTLAGCAVAVTVALATRDRLARATGLSTRQAGTYLIGLGAVLAVTIAPRSTGDTYYIFGPVTRSCQLLPPTEQVVAALTTAEWGFNLVLLVPVGWLCGSAPAPGAVRRLLAGAAAVPVAVEATQYLATDLHRVCQGLDLYTNWLGLVLGCAAAVARRRCSARHRPEHRVAASNTAG